MLVLTKTAVFFFVNHGSRRPQAADVPIVKLNPLNILTVKAEGEAELREVSLPPLVFLIRNREEYH